MAFEHTAAGPLTRWPVSVTCGHWTVGRPGEGKLAKSATMNEFAFKRGLWSLPSILYWLKIVITGESFCVGSYCWLSKGAKGDIPSTGAKLTKCKGAKDDTPSTVHQGAKVPICQGASRCQGAWRCQGWHSIHCAEATLSVCFLSLIAKPVLARRRRSLLVATNLVTVKHWCKHWGIGDISLEKPVLGSQHCIGDSGETIQCWSPQWSTGGNLVRDRKHMCL